MCAHKAIVRSFKATLRERTFNHFMVYKPSTCMSISLHNCQPVRVLHCTTVNLYQHIIVQLSTCYSYHCTTVNLYEYIIAQLSTCPSITLYNCQLVWAYHCTTVNLSEYISVQLSTCLSKVQAPNHYYPAQLSALISLIGWLIAWQVSCI